MIFNEVSFLILNVLADVLCSFDLLLQLLPLDSEILLLNINIHTQSLDFIQQILLLHSNPLSFGSKPLKLSLLVIFKSSQLVFLNVSQISINLILLNPGLQFNILLLLEAIKQIS